MYILLPLAYTLALVKQYFEINSAAAHVKLISKILFPKFALLNLHLRFIENKRYKALNDFIRLLKTLVINSYLY